jgi:hypothetical protein
MRTDIDKRGGVIIFFVCVILLKLAIVCTAAYCVIHFICKLW